PVHADEVALDDVLRGGVDGHAGAVGAVAADDVGRRRGATADGVVRGAAGEGHAVAGVEQGDGPGDVGADEVALDQVVGGAAAVDLDAVAVEGAGALGGAIPRNDVAGAGHRAADGIAGRAVEEDAVEVVGEGHSAALHVADEIALDKVARRERAGDQDAVL